MQTIVNTALKYAENEAEKSVDTGPTGKPRILIVGCGGAGNNTATRMFDVGIDGVEIIAINTDKQDLDRCRADKKILVGNSVTRGLGAGGDPKVGMRVAENARATLSEVLSKPDLVFITAGMGGGTGTGVAPIIADIAKNDGAIVVGIVSTPFHVERARGIKAEEGVQELSKTAHTVIALDNERLLENFPHLTVNQAFSVMDQLITEAVKGISDTITQPSDINLDYNDLRAVMRCEGVAVMLYGESSTRDKSTDVVRSAMNHPLLDVDYHGATGCFVHITGGPELTLTEANKITSDLTHELDPGANVILGTRILEEYEGMVRVMAIMTGVESAHVLGRAQQQRVPIPPIGATVRHAPSIPGIGGHHAGLGIDTIQWRS